MNCSIVQVHRLIDSGILDCLIALVSSENIKMIELGLDGMSNIIKKDPSGNSDANPFKCELVSKGAFTIVERLQEHQNHDVYMKAVALLEEESE